MMEVFAGYGAHCDYEMGRIVDAIKQMPDADNTIIIYIAGDNGSSAEGGIEGSVNENLFLMEFLKNGRIILKRLMSWADLNILTTLLQNGLGL